jgi:hypothetical protein
MKNLSGKPVIIIFTVLIIALLYLAFRPIPVSRDNSIVINTTVDKVSEGSEDNIILELNNAEWDFLHQPWLAEGIRSGYPAKGITKS